MKARVRSVLRGRIARRLKRVWKRRCAQKLAEITISFLIHHVVILASRPHHGRGRGTGRKDKKRTKHWALVSTCGEAQGAELMFGFERGPVRAKKTDHEGKAM